ncbi:MAG: ABC transporter permease, partial [Lachnospiraceae bacterium]|nr:ABC transporter permease [Lachnospiraceae bacterium]
AADTAAESNGSGTSLNNAGGCLALWRFGESGTTLEVLGGSGEVLYTMVIAIIVGIVVMYNLGVLSFVEKTREIATLKVLGFKTSGIRWILQQQNIFVTGLGTAIGLSLGLKMLMMLMSSLSVDDDYVYRISPMSYLLAFFLSFVLSLIVNSVLSSKVKDINMVEALKGVE